MKQIFDWLREQMRKHLYTDYTWTDFIEMDDAIRLVNEAEAKWEAECCEYKPRKAYKVGYCYTTGCGKERTHTLARESKYCEYCGKPINISEVE